MVAVTADGPTRHTMSLALEQQAPANPVSTIPPATVADELPVASERKPQPKRDTNHYKVRTPGQACSKAHQSDDVGTRFIDQKADECRRRAPQLSSYESRARGNAQSNIGIQGCEPRHFKTP